MTTEGKVTPLPFIVADYLDSPGMIAAYLDQFVSEGDEGDDIGVLKEVMATAVVALRRLQANEEAERDGT